MPDFSIAFFVYFARQQPFVTIKERLPFLLENEYIQEFFGENINKGVNDDSMSILFDFLSTLVLLFLNFTSMIILIYSINYFQSAVLVMYSIFQFI